MKRLAVVALGAAGIAAGGWLLFRPSGPLGQFADASVHNRETVDHYCLDCHNRLDRAGGITLEGLSADAVNADPGKFEAVARKLRGGLMPPPGNPQPDAHDVDSLVAWVEDTIDDSASAHAAGHVPVQRLTRTEYAHAVHDLVGVDIDPAEYLPTEIEVDGFTNVAAALSISPAFLEQYISVARTVARLAVGQPEPKLESAYFPPPGGDQDGYQDGMPLGTRGGTRFLHSFPADGEYRINITDLDVGLYPRSLETEHTLVVLVDREEVFRAKLGGPEDLRKVDLGGAPARAEIMQRFAGIPAEIRAGVHEIAVTFIERGEAATDGIIYGFTPYGGFSFTGQMRVPRVIGGIEVVGPYEPTGVSMTASREKIFVCTPPANTVVPAQSGADAYGAAAGVPAGAGGPADGAAAGTGTGTANGAGASAAGRTASPEARDCAEKILSHLARRAFRRPVDAADSTRLMPFFDAGFAAAPSDRAAFDTGIEQMLTAVLASPDFLYRTVAPPADAAGTFALSDIELASRLSFFLWSSGPDEELLARAEAGQLDDPAVLESEVRRMLGDPRAHALVTGFALAWLNLDDLDAVDPDDRLFPDFTEELRNDFATEMDLFLSSVLLGDADVRTLLTADYTFVNEQLAAHYGIDGVRGPQFRRVALADETRYGLLGKGAVLLRTSYGDRTSPVLRGAWVLDKLMGTPPTPPPPNVNTDLTTPAGELPKTVRVRLERHRSDQTCNGCHGVIDPYGLALENFSVTGRWRDVDPVANAPIDPRTELPGGRPVSGPVELRNALLERPDQFVQALTAKLLMYAIGRELEYYDMPQVRAIVRDAATADYRFSAIVAGVVASDSFRLQSRPVPESTLARAEETATE